jgi:hypothetical protein
MNPCINASYNFFNAFHQFLKFLRCIWANNRYSHTITENVCWPRDLRSFGRESFSIFADAYRSRKLITLGIIVTSFWKQMAQFKKFFLWPLSNWYSNIILKCC